MSRLMAGMLCGVSVLCVAAMLPHAPDGGAPVAPVQPAAAASTHVASADGAAAAASPALLPPPAAAPVSGPLAVFEISGSGSLLHVHGPQLPGQKPFKSSVKDSQLAPCIAGSDASCVGLLTADAGGKAYLFFDSLDTWRIATNLNGDGAATLTGIIDGKGGFTMAGTDGGSGDTQLMLTGKVSFAKGTLTPTKLSGKLTGVSMAQGHSSTGKFKSVALVP